MNLRDIKDWMILVVLAIVFSTIVISNAHADNFSEYYEEEIPYVFAYGKPFPELTVFKCVDSKLYKGRNIVRDYTGKAVKCEFKTMTRKEYEDLNNVTRTF